MLCQHCKKNAATVNYVEMVNGKKFEAHLCPSCYAYLYGELNNKINNDIWAGLFGTHTARKKACPVCRTTYEDFERTGLFGCTSCYDVFGKKGNNNDEFGLHRQLNSLQEQLENALREKKFTEADRLNKKINSIKKTMHGGGNG